ncbi:MAG TPA: flagellar motor switch protein FliN [Fibrobacteria bacterium]|nr:flagellar motor switch protein FliN [Fibrobacteria bacterium]
MAEDGPLSQADIDALTAGLLGDAASGGVDAAALRPEAEAILEQGSSVVGTLLNRAASMTVREIKDADAPSLGEGLQGDGLIVRLALDHGLPGEMCLVVRKETAALLCGLMMGGDGTEPFKDEDMDALNEFGNQFMGAVCTMLGTRYGVSVSAAQAHTGNFDPDQPPFALEGAALVEADLAIEGSSDSPFRLLFSPALAAKLAGSQGSSGSGSGGDGGDANPLANLGGFDTSLARNLEDSPANIQMLLDINLNVTIELGRTRLSIRKILELGPGSIIELDRLAGEPVDLLVNDKVVAKGEVVVVDEYFGIRIISLVSPEERIKQLK